MDNPVSYAPGLMLGHVDAAGERKHEALEAKYSDSREIPYTPIDRFTLSYAPTKEFFPDVLDATKTKLGAESESVLGLRSQMEFIQGSEKKINWVVHSRGGPEFVQAASGSALDSLNKNAVVFHAGANTKWSANSVMQNKKIGDAIDEENRYRDSPYDLVPQIIGLRGIESPFNFVRALLFAPCLSSAFCSIDKSPHTLPYQWNNLKKQEK